MKRKRTAKRTVQKVKTPPRTLHIIDETGKEVSCFTLSEEHPKATLHIDLREPNPLETPEARLEREAWDQFEDALDTLKELYKIAPEKAVELYTAFFTEPAE